MVPLNIKDKVLKFIINFLKTEQQIFLIRFSFISYWLTYLNVYRQKFWFVEIIILHRIVNYTDQSYYPCKNILKSFLILSAYFYD